MKKEDLKVGDYVLYPYAWPGPDIAKCKVLDIKGDNVTIHDEGFDIKSTVKFSEIYTSPRGRKFT